MSNLGQGVTSRCDGPRPSVRRNRTRPTEAVSALQPYYAADLLQMKQIFFKEYGQDGVTSPAGRAPPPRPEPTVRTSAWRDITSKLQMPEVDVKLPQSRGNGSPPTSDFCITTKSVEWSVRADVAKRSFLFSGRPTHTCRWIAPRWCEGVSMFTGHPAFA